MCSKYDLEMAKRPPAKVGDLQDRGENIRLEGLHLQNRLRKHQNADLNFGGTSQRVALGSSILSTRCVPAPGVVHAPMAIAEGHHGDGATARRGQQEHRAARHRGASLCCLRIQSKARWI